MAVTGLKTTSNISLLRSTAMVDISVPTIQTSVPPTVSLFGVGGFGINMASRITDSLDQSFLLIDHLTCTRYFDTSTANIRNQEKVHVIAGSGHGSGKVRSANFDEIRQNLIHLSEDELPVNDVSILIFSLGGGTGSVLGPLLMRELSKKKSQVVVIAVADMQSEIDNSNTLATLKSLQNIAEKNNIYLPMMLYNNVQMGRSAVDKDVIKAVSDLILILTRPAYEIDRNDRLSWLNASDTVGTGSGLRQLDVWSAANPVQMTADSKLIFESVLSLGVRKDDASELYEFRNRTRFRKDGWFADATMQPMLGTIRHSTDMIAAVMNDIQESQEMFSSQSKNSKASPISISKDEADDDSGMVL